jgi:hypothetical protein
MPDKFFQLKKHPRYETQIRYCANLISSNTNITVFFLLFKGFQLIFVLVHCFLTFSWCVIHKKKASNLQEALKCLL